MTTTLITFLGRAPKPDRPYRTTRYDFGAGDVAEPAAFFGWPLTARVQPDQLVILGTSGSMWDHLFEADHDFGDHAEDARLALVEAVEHKRVEADQLAPLVSLLELRLACKVHLELIPYCRSENEQVKLLQILSAHVGKGDRVHLDITHGFRTLPMLGVIAALYLRRVHEASIEGIWYGEYDPDTQAAPVQNLEGLLHIADWVAALTNYEKDGDYGVFAPLLGEAGKLLTRAAFFERTSNPVKAREALNGWASRADRFPTDDPACELFREEMERRVSWYRGTNRAAWERSLANEYLARRDYLRAAIYGMESMITARCLQEGSGDGYEAREKVREVLKDDQEGFRTLGKLRNALAHGQRSRDKKVAKALTDANDLHNTIKSLFRQMGIA